MSTGLRWQDIKAEAHRHNPEPADPERQARSRAELDAHIAGHHLDITVHATGAGASRSISRLVVPRQTSG